MLKHRNLWLKMHFSRTAAQILLGYDTIREVIFNVRSKADISR